MPNLHVVIVSTREGRQGPAVGSWFYEHAKPEYNYFTPPSLVNALDYLVHEWAYKPVGFVSYGGVAGGTRSVQVTKGIITSLKMMPMVEAVHIPFFAKHIDKETGKFMAEEIAIKSADTMLNELLRWTEALKTLRT